MTLALVAVASMFGAVAHAVVGAPVLNNNQAVLNSGTTLTLSWTAPTLGTPTSYIIEASTTPAGPANLANFNTGNAQTTLVVANLPVGTYYVRVRGVDASGPGPTSNEVQLNIGGGATCPSAPRALTVVQNGGTITLAWQAPVTGVPTSYVIQAGSTAGAANIANVDTGRTALGISAPVPPGTYFLRVYARSSGCPAPALLSPASNEVQVSIGGASLSAPVFNNNLPLLASGPTLTLTWTAPSTGQPTGYAIVASSAPGGSGNIGTIPIGSTQTSAVFASVPAGTYYLRVRAVNASGPGPLSNEVQVVVSNPAGICPSAPRGLNVVAQGGGMVTLGWQPPLTGVASSYVVRAGSTPGTAVANVDTGSTALSLTVPVPAGSYFVRIYARNSACAGPSFVGPASNEVLLSSGGAPAWRGQIECRSAISGTGYSHNETQTWFVGGPGQRVSSARVNYPVVWTAQGSGGSAATPSWTINQTTTTDLSATVVASTGIPIFDRTTTAIVIPGGIVAQPNPFTLHEMEFPAIVAPSASATVVTGTWSRPTVGGDGPQMPGDATGTLSCTWSLRYQ